MTIAQLQSGKEKASRRDGKSVGGFRAKEETQCGFANEKIPLSRRAYDRGNVNFLLRREFSTVVLKFHLRSAKKIASIKI